MAVSLFTACKNDKSSKDKDDRSSTKEKDDYSNSDDKKEDKSTDYKTKDDNTATDDKPAQSDDDNGAGWSRSDENKFMDDCEGTAKVNVGAARANEYCDCMLQRMKRKYSSYREADRDLAGATQDEINKLAAPCNGK